MIVAPGLKLWRKRRLKKLHPDGRLTAHFRYTEFYCRDGTPYPVNVDPELKKHVQRFLEPMRKKFGACHVLSAYRHTRYNASIGGAKASQHDYDERDGTATDLMFARGTVQQWAAEARAIRAKTGGGSKGRYRQ